MQKSVAQQLQADQGKKSKKFPLILFFITAGLIAFSISVILKDRAQNAEIITISNPNNNPEIAAINELSGNAENYIAQGDIYLNSRNFGKALQSYVTAYQLDQNSIIPFLRIIDVYLLTENYETAFENIQLTEKRAKNHPDLQLAKVRYTLAEGDYNEARLMISQISEVSEKVALYKAVIEIMAGDHEKAQTLLNDLSNIIQDQKIKKTVSKLREAYSLFNTFAEGNNAYLNVLLGQVLNQEGEYKLARELLYRSIEQINDFRDAWIGLGYAFLQIRNYPQAEQALNKAKELDPYKPETYLYLGIVSEEKGDYKKALGYLTQAENYKYSNPIEVSEHLAINYYSLGRYEEALPYYIQTINNKNVPIEYYIAPIWIALEQTQNYDLAEQIAIKSQERYPNNAETHNYLGWVKLYQQDFDIAKSELTKAISLNANLAPAYLNFGLLFKLQGKLDTAIPFYEKAISIADQSGNKSIKERAESELKAIQKEINDNI